MGLNYLIKDIICAVLYINFYLVCRSTNLVFVLWDDMIELTSMKNEESLRKKMGLKT